MKMVKYNINSNFHKIIEHFKKQLPEEYHTRLVNVFNEVGSYVKKSGINIKILNNGQKLFKGLRTKNYIIISSPKDYKNVLDFIYILFHEIRHEIQVSELKWVQPLSGDFNKFEEEYEVYWSMELDAHNFGLLWVEKVNKILNFSDENYTLSNYITEYPNMRDYVMVPTKSVNYMIKDLRDKGIDYDDFSNLPIVQNLVGDLEELF
jgi:hypothetical protein